MYEMLLLVIKMLLAVYANHKIARIYEKNTLKLGMLMVKWIDHIFCPFLLGLGLITGL